MGLCLNDDLIYRLNKFIDDLGYNGSPQLGTMLDEKFYNLSGGVRSESYPDVASFPASLNDPSIVTDQSSGDTYFWNGKSYIKLSKEGTQRKETANLSLVQDAWTVVPNSFSSCVTSFKFYDSSKEEIELAHRKPNASTLEVCSTENLDVIVDMVGE